MKVFERTSKCQQGKRIGARAKEIERRLRNACVSVLHYALRSTVLPSVCACVTRTAQTSMCVCLGVCHYVHSMARACRTKRTRISKSNIAPAGPCICCLHHAARRTIRTDVYARNRCLRLRISIWQNWIGSDWLARHCRIHNEQFDAKSSWIHAPIIRLLRHLLDRPGFA